MIQLLFLLSLISSDKNRDFYKILNITHDATDSQIKKRYIILSNKYHPDKNKEAEAEQIYTDVNDAYQTLIDINKRRIYDLYGEPGVHLYESPQTDVDPLVFLTGSQSADAGRDKVKKRGKPIQFYFPVELEDFYVGRPIELNITRSVMCRCPTPGYFCSKCRGRTTIRQPKIVKSYLEKGFPEGKVITMKNYGDYSEANGPADLLITLISKPHKTFTRVGDDLHMTVNVTLKEAFLGFKRTVEGIDRKPLVIESHDSFTEPIVIPNRGLPKYMYPGVYGNVVVTPHILWPKDLSTDSLSKILDAM
jgi:DnaJ family protein B protein 11